MNVSIPYDAILDRLARSDFRRKFSLSPRETAYFYQKGNEVIRDHARGFIKQRLAPANPHRDGKQTPMRNHPVFVAQHATATCCRGCLARRHGIEQGKPLSENDIEFIAGLIMAWLERNLKPVSELTYE